ncbi:unnamed protein product [Phytophthora fragariaefolia]|uniref:Unnamed protein product n=1 Tax=Phytophthora fragariaefolia TaxID=1490495 RepID=A0A9W7CJ90_9STRA|nr:unnamed protein product [Phytophthora fragariaefolia]
MLHLWLHFDPTGTSSLSVASTSSDRNLREHAPALGAVDRQLDDPLAVEASGALGMRAVGSSIHLLPAEYESLNLATFRAKLEKKREVLEEKKKQEEERGASWGFGEDAEDEDQSGDDDAAESKEDLPDYLRNLKEEEDQPYKSSVTQAQVNEKDQRLYQQLQTRIRKMENLKLERSRILAKQNQLDGLTEGQQRTLERNEQRIDALMKEIDDLEGKIHAKNVQRTNTGRASGTAARKKRNINEELYGYNSDEDDFYDRTKANQQKIAARKQKVTEESATSEATATARPRKSEVLTADLIQANVEKLEAELVKLQADLTAASAKVATAADQDTDGENKNEDEVDSLDSFMVATTTQLHESEISTLTKRKIAVEMELKRQRQLLIVATPALAALPVKKSVANPSTELATSNSLMPSSENGSSAQALTSALSSIDKPKLTEPTSNEAMPTKKHYSPTKSHTPELNSKPAYESKVCCTSLDVAQKASYQAQPELSAPKRRRISGPALGPPREAKPSASSEQHGDDASVLEGGDQVWVPPTNQTGDGRTALNDKYGY